MPSPSATWGISLFLASVESSGALTGMGSTHTSKILESSESGAALDGRDWNSRCEEGPSADQL